MLPLLAAYAFVIGTCVLWLGTGAGIPLRDQLVVAQRPALDLLVLVVVALATASAAEIARWFRRNTRVGWPHLLAVAVLALVVTLAVPPRTSRIYYDEQIYQSVAHNMADLGRAQMCNDGSMESGRLQCWRGEYNKQPYGYPHVLSLLYRAFGVSERFAYDWNLCATVLLAVAVCLLASIAWRDARAGVFAGAIVALLPEQLLWSRTAASEPSAALFASAAVLSWMVFARLRSTVTLCLAVAVSAWAVQFRPESVLLIPVLAAYLLVAAPEEFRRRRFWWAVLAGLVLCAPLVGHFVAVRNEGWGTTGDRMSLAYVAGNLRANGWFYVWDERFPWFVTASAFLGLTAARRAWREMFLVASWFGVYFAIYLAFYAGSYNYGADVRYSLLTYPAIAALAGYGVSRACDLGHRMLPTRPAVPAAAIAALLVLLWLNYLPLARALGEEAWAAREDVAFARDFAMRLPPNSLVLTHNPNMFLLWGISAAQVSIAATEPRYVASVYFPRYYGGVYFHWNFWCNVNDPLQRQFCVDVRNKYDLVEVESGGRREQRFALYRVAGVKPERPPEPDHSDTQ